MKIYEDGNAVIQPMLDKGGTVDVRGQGVYLIHKPLVIRAHTLLRVGPGVTLRAAPRSLCSLIENAAFYGGGVDEDIEIVGGVWDGNCDEQGLDPEPYTLARNDLPYDPRRFTGKLLRFAHVRGFTLRDATVMDPVSYGVQIADAHDFLVRDLHFDYNCHFGTADGVHINGPASDGRILRMHGMTNDDMVSLTPVDENHAEVTRGPIARVEIDGVHAENGYTGVRLLSSGEPLTDVVVRNISGTYRHNAVCVTHHNVHPGEPIWLDNIVIDGVRASKSDQGLPEGCFTYWEKGAFNGCPVVWVAQGVRVGSLTIRNVERDEETATSARTVQVDAEAKIDRLTVENVRHSFACGQKMPPFCNEGEVKELRVSGVVTAAPRPDR